MRIVLARSVYKHSLNYRSVVLLGRARPVEDDEEKRAALVAVVEHIVPGRSADARPPNSGELRGTSVLSLPIREASAKVREGGPNDFENDVATDVWAGVIPLALVASPPEPEERVPPNVKVPMYAADYVRTAGQ